MGYQALLFCTDEKLARVVSQVFSELDFTVDPVIEPFGAVKKLMSQHYDALVVDCDNEQNSSLLFKSAHNSSFNQGSLAIALVEGQAGVAKAYRIGANLVLTKPINVEQTKGTLRVARGLLRKNSDAASASHLAAAEPVQAASIPPAPAARSAQPVNRDVEVAAPRPVPVQAPEFEAPLPAVAASLRIEEKPVPVPAPAAQIKTPVVQAPMESTLFAAEEARNEATKTEKARSAAATTPVFSPAPASRGAAAAPAPAREADQEEPAEIRPATQPQPNFMTATVNMPDGPSFAALDVEDAGGSGGSKKILFAVAAVLVVAAGGYFGWTKFGSTHTSPVPQAAVVTPQPRMAPAPDLTPTPVPASATSAGTTSRLSATTTAPASKILSIQPDKPSVGATSVTRIAALPEPEIKKPAGTPLLVKPGTTAPKTQSDDSSAPLPSPLAVASTDASSLTGLISSASVARPTLARIRVSQGVSQGLVIKRVQPKYPANALAAHTQGAVQIEATVNKEGNVVNLKVLSGDRTLAAAALEAVRQWRYKPYYLDGEPVEIQTEITVNFKSN